MSEELSQYTRRLRDAVLENSAMLEDISADAGNFLMDWGVEQALIIGPPITDEEQLDTLRGALMRVLSSTNALCKRRAEGEEVLKGLQGRVNRFAETPGIHFRTIMDEQFTELMVSAPGVDDLAFLQTITSILVPPTTEESAEEETMLEHPDETMAIATTDATTSEPDIEDLGDDVVSSPEAGSNTDITDNESTQSEIDMDFDDSDNQME